MRGGVVPRHVDAAHRALLAAHLLADAEFAFQHRAEVQHRVAEPLHVLDLELDATGAGVVDDAGVADLAALLGVEIGAVEQQRRRLPGPECAGSDDVVAQHPAEHGGVAQVRVVLRRVVGLRQIALHGRHGELLAALRARSFDSSMTRSYSAMSTARPCSAAICWVMSMYTP